VCGWNLWVARNRGLVSVNLKWRGLEGNDGVCINLRYAWKCDGFSGVVHAWGFHVILVYREKK
jgi:hypothetical protein